MASVSLPTQVLPRNISFENLMLQSGIIPYMRSRNVEFIAKRMKPFTRLYGFFGGIDINKFIVPKLLEISMNSGVFQVGETVVGSFDNLTSNLPNITFRVAKQNHKYGAYNSPTDIFVPNPYNLNLIIPSDYSATSTILNIDTYSLSSQPESQFTGYVAVGMKLRGQTSKAQATITDVKLISDQVGTVIGSFFIPDGNIDVNPRFESGSKLFRLTNNPTNSQTFGTFMTSAEATYSSQGSIIDDGGQIRPMEVDSPQTSETPIAGPGNSSGGAVDGGSGPDGEVEPPQPLQPAPTTLSYNYSGKTLGPAAVRDLKTLMRASGLFTRSQIKSVSTNTTGKRESKIVGKINNSSWAKSNSVRVKKSNTGTKRSVSGVSVPGTSKSVGGRASSSKGASSGGGRSSGGRGGRGGGRRAAPGGGRGRRSDIQLKKNITTIDNALNRLMNIHLINEKIY